VGQLEESGEYRTGRLRVVSFHIWSFEGGSPRLCRLRIASVVALLQQALSCVLAHTRFMRSRKLSSFDDC
jgi:hypothetical protein